MGTEVVIKAGWYNFLQNPGVSPATGSIMTRLHKCRGFARRATFPLGVEGRRTRNFHFSANPAGSSH